MRQLPGRLLLIVLLLCQCLYVQNIYAQTVPVDFASRLLIDREPLVSGETAMLGVVLDVPAGFHAQSHTPLDDFLIPLEVSPVQTPGLTFGTPIYPRAEIKHYPDVGRQSVLSGRVTILIPVTADTTIASSVVGGPTTIEINLTFQACNDEGMCFPPQRRVLTLPVPVLLQGTSQRINTDIFSTVTSDVKTTDATTSDAKTFDAKTFDIRAISLSLLTALAAGLLFNVMPCVLPVLPLKAIAFYEVAGQKRGKSFLLGLVFAGGMIGVFALLGVAIFPLTLFKWGELFMYGWFVWPMVILLTIMALGLFGIFNVNLPIKIYSFTPRHDTIAGNFFWGALTAVLATPCTAPLLPPLMIWAAQQPSLVAVLTMTCVGVGMSLPYVILSALPNVARAFPRTGPWGELFKQMMGFLVLGTAVWLASGRLITGPGFWYAVACVGWAAAVFLLVRSLRIAASRRSIVLAGVAGIFLAAIPTYAAYVLNISVGRWTQYSVATFNAARQTQPVLVKFTANWCATCQVIEANVYSKPDVWQALKSHNIQTFKADLTFPAADASTDANPLLTQLNPAGGIPLTAIFTPGNAEPIVLSSLYTHSELLDVVRRLR
jgi:thiol:disulfide interchange protein